MSEEKKAWRLKNLDEKKLDRMVNKGFIQFRKFQDKITCPTCNLPEIFNCMLNSYYDEEKEKFIDRKHEHDTDNCFRIYHSMMLAVEKDKNGKFLGLERIDDMIENGLKKLKRMDKKFTEKQR